MSLAHFSTGAWLIAFFMGAAWAAPTTPSSGTQTKIERDSQIENVPIIMQATAENNRTESATKTLGVELPSEFPEEVECQTAWQKFMVDFGIHYSSEAEAQKRRGIFCENWQGIQEHNAQFEVGKVSFKKKINQWADLTFEEWKDKQRPILEPEFATAKPTTKASEEDQTRIKCEAAWQKFLDDFSRKYENDAETKKRHSIFCNNWQRIQKHNAKYEAGIVAHKKGINQWSDLTFEEWKKTQESRFPPNADTAGNKTAEPEKAPENKEEPGTFTAETNLKLEAQLVEEPSQTQSLEDPSRKELPEAPVTYLVIPEESEIDNKMVKCQAAWEKFLVDFSKKYENDGETEKRRSIFCYNWQRIQEHNAKYEAGIVAHKKGINHWSDLTFEEWREREETRFPEAHKFPEEAPGIYIAETTQKPKLETQPVEVPSQIQELENPSNKELYVKPEESEVKNKRIQCQVAWKKFLSDYSPKYENDDETKIRHSIFCGNWQKIQEYNLLYESGKKNINKWSDLTLEELQRLSPDTLMENKTNETDVEEYPDMSPRSFPVNTEKPGTYVAKKSVKPKLVNETQSVEVPIQIKEIKQETESELDPKNINCQGAWEKFLSDYSPKYENDDETRVRKSIFCDNWQKIQDYNLLYESGKKKINKWSDLTLEELQRLNPDTLMGNKTNETDVEEYPDMPPRSFPVNTEKPGTYVDSKNKKCQAAWEKFLSDYSPKYENDDETRVRKSIFCDNWQKVQENNAQYELGKVSHKESMNKFSDLTFEELKSQSPNILPPNLKPSENKTDEPIVQVGSQQIWFPPNMEAPGIYVKETTVKPKLIDEKLVDDVPRIEEFKSTGNTKLPGNKEEAANVEVGNLKTYIVKTEASEVEQKRMKCQAAWEQFLSEYSPKYENDAEIKIRRSIFCENLQRIQAHNALYNLGKVTHEDGINEWSDLTSAELKNQNPNILPPHLKPTENQAKPTTVEVGSQQIWFPANKEEAGTYTKPAKKSESLRDVTSK